MWGKESRAVLWLEEKRQVGPVFFFKVLQIRKYKLKSCGSVFCSVLRWDTTCRPSGTPFCVCVCSLARGRRPVFLVIHREIRLPSARIPPFAGHEAADRIILSLHSLPSPPPTGPVKWETNRGHGFHVGNKRATFCVRIRQ